MYIGYTYRYTVYNHSSNDKFAFSEFSKNMCIHIEVTTLDLLLRALGMMDVSLDQ